MKIKQVNNEQLEISDSGKSNIFSGIMVMIVGVVAGASPLFSNQIPWWVSLIGGGFLLLGGFMLKSASSSLIVLRRGGDSEVTIKKLIGGASTHNSFNSSSVTKVRLETYTDYSNSNNSSSSSTQRDIPQRERVSKLLLAMQDGSELEISTKRVVGSSGLSLSGFSAGSLIAAPLSKEASQIAEFLGVPLDTSQRGEMGIIDVAQAAQSVFTNQAPSSSTSTVAQAPISPVSVAPIVPVTPVESAPAAVPISPVTPVIPVATDVQVTPVMPVIPLAATTVTQPTDFPEKPSEQ